MSASPNVGSIIARMLAQRLAGGQGAQQGPAQAAPTEAGQQISSQLAELQGSDPQSTVKLLMQIKSQLVALYPRTAFTTPGVARNIAQCQKYLDNAIEDAKKATAVASSISPIANNAGQPQTGPEQNGPGLQQFAMGAQ